MDTSYHMREFGFELYPVLLVSIVFKLAVPLFLLSRTWGLTCCL